MSDFTSDLNAEKLGEIEAQIQELGSEVSENRGDIDRLETIEFFDRNDGSRQVIVHWLEDVDGGTVVSIGNAKEEFVKFSEERAEDPNEHQVSHGDVLVIGGDCPWYAICAKVDRGVGGGDVGFQAEDPMDVAGTELENDEPYKEFVIWGGCGIGDGDGGGAGDGCVGTPSSISVSTALAVTSGGAGPPLQLSAITPDPDAPDPPDEFTFNSGLSEFTIVEDADADAEDGASFLAFDDSSIQACPDGCGVKVDLKVTELEKKLHKINAKPIEQKKVTIYPQKLNSKNYTSQTGTITVSTATISSDKCGNLSSDGGGGGGGGGGGTNFGLATLIEGAPIHDEKDIDLLNIEDVEPDNLPIVSIGNLILPSDFSQSALESESSLGIAGKKAFIPMVEPETCPTSTEIDVVDGFWANSTTAEVTRACDSTGTQEITVSMFPKKNKLEFKCGLLVNETPEESQADSIPMTFTMTLPCGSSDLSWKDLEICENGVSSTIQVAFRDDDGEN